MGARHNMPPPPDLLTLKVVSESRVMWDVPILVFPGRSVLDFIIIIIIIKHVAYWLRWLSHVKDNAGAPLTTAPT